MKDFLEKAKKYFKRVFSGENETLEDIKQSIKDTKQLRIIGIVVFLVGSALSGAISALLGVLAALEKKIELLTCDSCHAIAPMKTEEDFEKHISCDAKCAVFHIGKPQQFTNDKGRPYVSVEGEVCIEFNLNVKCPSCENVTSKTVSVSPFKYTLDSVELITTASSHFEDLRWYMTRKVGMALYEYMTKTRFFDKENSKLTIPVLPTYVIPNEETYDLIKYQRAYENGELDGEGVERYQRLVSLEKDCSKYGYPSIEDDFDKMIKEHFVNNKFCLKIYEKKEEKKDETATEAVAEAKEEATEE